MKRFGNLYSKIADRKNIEISATLATEGHRDKIEVQRFLLDKENLLDGLQRDFENKEVRFSEMKSFTVYEPKKRVIHHPPFWPDRVIHHTLMNVIKPIFVRNFITDTYSSIEGRGLTKMIMKIKKIVRQPDVNYYLQIDVKHYFESINHEILLEKVKRLIKDNDVIDLINKMLQKHDKGLAIGCYPSQYLANLYLSGIDHYAKEVLRLKYYVRYMDDILILCNNKAQAHNLLADLRQQLGKIKLEVKNNARIAPISVGIDFCGYRYFPTHTLLKKRIKNNMRKLIRKCKTLNDKDFKRRLAPHWGWCKRANCINLAKKLFAEKYDVMIRRLSDIKAESFWGLSKERRMSINDLIDKDIAIFDYKPLTIKGEQKIIVKFSFPESENEFHTFITRSEVIRDRLVNDNQNLPFIVTIRKRGKYYCYE